MITSGATETVPVYTKAKRDESSIHWLSGPGVGPFSVVIVPKLDGKMSEVV